MCLPFNEYVYVHSIVIDGNWGGWTGWSTCPVTCGVGKHSRSRECTAPVPKDGGKDCVGESKEEQACNTIHCPSMYMSLYTHSQLKRMLVFGYYLYNTSLHVYYNNSFYKLNFSQIFTVNVDVVCHCSNKHTSTIYFQNISIKFDLVCIKHINRLCVCKT